VRLKEYLLIAIVFLGAIVVLPLFKSTEFSIDSSSGRVRTQQYLGPILLSSHVRDTNYSNYVKTLNPQQRTEIWHLDSTTSIFQLKSPYYRYHGVAYALDSFMSACEVFRVRENEKKRVALQILDLLRQDKPFEVKTASASIEANRMRISVPVPVQCGVFR